MVNFRFDPRVPEESTDSMIKFSGQTENSPLLLCHQFILITSFVFSTNVIVSTVFVVVVVLAVVVSR